MKVIGWRVLSSWYWDSTVPIAKLEASHSRQNFPWLEGKVRMGVEVTADFRVSKVLCCAGPQDHIWDFWVRAWRGQAMSEKPLMNRQ